MNKAPLALAARIRQELREIDRLIERVDTAWKRAQESTEDFYLDSVALNLHSFYTALERVFELVAAEIDQSKPRGENWHQALLQQMALEIPLVRPRLISPETKDRLEEYRGFRHVVRNIYTFRLSPNKMKPLVDGLDTVFTQAKAEIESFLSFLEARAAEE